MSVLLKIAVLAAAVLSAGSLDASELGAVRTRWEAKVGGCISVAPKLSDELVIAGACSGEVKAYDRDSGKEVWSHSVVEDGDRGIHAEMLLDEDRLFVGSDGRVGHLRALDATTGRLLWKHAIQESRERAHFYVDHPTTGARTAITRVGTNLVFATYTGQLVAIDSETGRLQWQFHPPEFDGAKYTAMQHAASAGRVYFGSPTALYAIDGSSGEQAWKTSLDSPVSGGVIQSGGYLYLGTVDAVLYRIAASSGEIVARLKVADQPGYSPPIVAGNALVMPSDHGRVLVGYDLALQRQLWRLTADGEWSTPRLAVQGGVLMSGNSRGSVIAIDPDSGRIDWTAQLRGMVRGLEVSRDVLYAGNTSGELFAIAPPTTNSPEPTP